jgi:predicted metal-binding protein
MDNMNKKNVFICATCTKIKQKLVHEIEGQDKQKRRP